MARHLAKRSLLRVWRTDVEVQLGYAIGLTGPILSRVSCYGYFGSNAADMLWEQTGFALSVS